jgi:hypothetical protein
VALESLHNARLNVVPHPDTPIQRPRQDVLPVRREFHARGGRVVFVNERAETLAAMRVPDSD